MLRYYLFFGFLLVALTATSQHAHEGLWAVHNVSITGQGEMTPEARWFHLYPEGRVTGGNGGVLHTRGSYSFLGDSLIFFNESGQPDPYGPFLVKFEENWATWTRTEDGNDVVVNLRKVKEQPQALWDKLQGIWFMQGMPRKQINFRWDREYRVYGDWYAGGQSGIWHVPAHRSELRLVPFAPDNPTLTWTLSFENDSIMIWADGEQELRFQKKE